MAADRPLTGIRVLSLEQAAALPWMTRHLVDLGADVIRVQSHRRGGRPTRRESSLYRGKQSFGLDLTAAGGPDVFRALAARCDVVAHNFTPRVMRKYGLEFADIAAVNPRVIYCAVSGFGGSGPWSERPLFGPGAEAVSGHNLLIGEATGSSPGRPGTTTYADYNCGSWLLFAVLQALYERRFDAAPRARRIDISLYETAVALLGGVIAERSLGGGVPERCGNADARMALQAVLQVAGDARDDDAWVAVSVEHARATAVAAAFGVATLDALPAVCRQLPADVVVARLHAVGVAAARCADAADVLADPQLRLRGFFGHVAAKGEFEPGPAWGGGAEVNMASFQPLGAASRTLLSQLAEWDPATIADLEDRGVIATATSTALPPEPTATASELAAGIQRRELKRIETPPDVGTPDPVHCHVVERGEVATPGGSQSVPVPVLRVVELAGGVSVALAARLLGDGGHDVVRVEASVDALSAPDAWRHAASPFGGGAGGLAGYLDRGKRVVAAGSDDARAVLANADVVVGDLRPAALHASGLAPDAVTARHVVASLTPFGLHGPRTNEPCNDFTLQAASGFMTLTGEHDEPPQQLPPHAAGLLAGVVGTAAILAHVMASSDGAPRRLDLAVVEALASFGHLALARYVETGEVARREGQVKAALRMARTADRYLYCAPGAVAAVDMAAMAELLAEPRLASARFRDVAGRQQHWDEYVALMQAALVQRPAQAWFDAALERHMTFALVQSIDDLFACPQLQARGLLRPMPLAGGRVGIAPGLPYQQNFLDPDPTGGPDGHRAT